MSLLGKAPPRVFINGELLAVAEDLPTIVGHEVPGQVLRAGKRTDLHAQPCAA